jgi:hypothetical protein
MPMLVWTVMVLAAGAMAMAPRVLAHYVGRLPYAPECPACHAVTGQSQVHGALDRLCALLAATPVRHCARCGWAGRMRWRVAPEHVRGRHRRRA